MGQARCHVEGLGSPVHEIVYDDPHHVGEPLAPVFRVPGRRGPAGFAVQLKGLFEFRGATDPAFLKDNAPLLSHFLQGVHNPHGELDGLLDQHIQGVLIQFAVAFKVAEGTVVELVLQDKEKIFLIKFKMTHGRCFSFILGSQAERLARSYYLVIILLGSHMAISGKIITSARQMAWSTTKGRMER